MINFEKKPFYLNKEKVDWVKKTFYEMSVDEKIGQLFLPVGYSSETKYLDDLLEKKIGGLFFRPGDFKELQATFNYMQKNSKIPLLTAANLEAGGSGAIVDGVDYAPQMAIGATADGTKYSYKLGEICAKSAKLVGINWGFSPVVDLDLNFRNPIINVRSFGNNSKDVINLSKQYIQAFNDQELLTSIKHFPGDGVDERDQHLLTSINSLSKSAWYNSYGEIYKELINFGTKTIMVGHIAFPAYTGTNTPASLSKDIVTKLLREELGYNGLVITDATPMVGFASAMSRREAVPTAIQSGCDMFLFNHDLSEDIKYMKEGLDNGLLTVERLDEAVLRILATKASINIHNKNNQVYEEDNLKESFCDDQKQIANESITLVTDSQNLLPITPQKHKKILLEILGDYESNVRVENSIKNKLENYGFDVTLYEPEKNFYELGTVEEFKSKYDLVIYAANIETSSNQTVARINWKTFFGLGNNVPWFVKEIPTLFISFGNPYHYIDVPMISTLINSYSNFDHFIDATIEKLVGKSKFLGSSPIDLDFTNSKLEKLKKF
ncbi:glycoside hydrolase family 3 protein [Lactococcus lactis]|uniref:glycoside hydrolase family 3 protein n=1 Tax=Lactococcus lactis TaxID=1358 RepID=UPI00071CE0D4|nr:glycoside hydrolase family 3 N-terminal domain-containing protein [Lactococcus lactis]KST87825.1 Beta-hexosaminidase [Lactococcus lactis subsp. lactis]